MLVKPSDCTDDGDRPSRLVRGRSVTLNAPFTTSSDARGASDVTVLPPTERPPPTTEVSWIGGARKPVA